MGALPLAADIAATAGSSPLHPIPADKGLPAGWLETLFARGEKTLWQGEELKTVGMPVGGIGTGQLYLCGDGTLGLWEIFNEHMFPGSGAKCYAARSIPKPVSHGLALFIESHGNTACRKLDQTGFDNVTFRGEYPIGTVHYADPGSPIAVTLEAFSPFIPLNAGDSGLPVTFFQVTLKNTSREPVRAGMLSWLENPVAAQAVNAGHSGRRKTRIVRSAHDCRIIHSAEPDPEEQQQQSATPPVIFADFDGTTYGDWKVTGTAFGTAPVKQDLPKQQKVTGYSGPGLANSFVGEDDTQGQLTSPEFTISHRFINFLVGGGRKPLQAGMALVVDGQQVRQVTGDDSEALRWASWNVRDLKGKQAHLEIYDRAAGPWGHTLIDQIEFSDQPRMASMALEMAKSPDSGTLVWVSVGEALDPKQTARIAGALPQQLRETMLFEDWTSSSLGERRNAALATRPVDIHPNESRTFRFLLAWHFPNTVKPNREAGHEYAARFTDASAVADYALHNYTRLAADTRKWRDTWYESTLPVWLLDRLHISASCLASGTCMWWKDGRFWAWEGVVCCEGTCTHVWNYAHSLARLFPQLERSVRERQDLGVGLTESGLVGMRHNGAYAADGQCGTVLKVWREHLTSPDDQFLRRSWPAVKKVMEFAIKQDNNADGLIENAQPNTYDIDFFGANTYVGTLYLAALLAAEQMAVEMGDQEYAQKVRKIFESGKRLTEDLWNGEYFIQVVDLKEHPKHQYATGCLSDQLFGQNWAHQTGLGYVCAPDKARKALESIWKYNWAPDTGVYNKLYPASRSYTDDREAGLFICTWPKSPHLDEGVLYRDEVWTGIEYQVAAHMIYEGMLQEGLAICRAVHDRYHPAKRNPFNEVECSDFYARAMSSWGVLLALSGFQYHGPKGHIGFAPTFKPEEFQCAFTAAQGWGSFHQKTSGKGGIYTLDLRHGKLALATMDLELPAEGLSAHPKVTVGTQPVPVTSKTEGRRLRIEFKQTLQLDQGQKLTIKV